MLGSQGHAHAWLRRHTQIRLGHPHISKPGLQVSLGGQQALGHPDVGLGYARGGGPICKLCLSSDEALEEALVGSGTKAVAVQGVCVHVAPEHPCQGGLEGAGRRVPGQVALPQLLQCLQIDPSVNACTDSQRRSNPAPLLGGRGWLGKSRHSHDQRLTV